MKEPSQTYAITDEQIALLLRAVEQAARCVEDAIGLIVRNQELAKEAQARGNAN